MSGGHCVSCDLAETLNKDFLDPALDSLRADIAALELVNDDTARTVVKRLRHLECLLILLGAGTEDDAELLDGVIPSPSAEVSPWR